MFCPQCGTNQSDDMKFCKSCGANLFAVRQAVTTRETGGKFDWSKTWVAEMMLSEGEREKRKEELERQRGITPQSQSQKEIKGGVITASVGLGLMIFLYVFMQGLILGGNIGPDVAPIIARLWIAGVIPLFVGVGLLINGVFVKGAPPPTKRVAFEKENQALSLPPAESSEFNRTPASVTEHTTRQLQDSELK